MARLLERLGLLVRDADSDYLDFEPGEAFDRLVGASIHYRIAPFVGHGRAHGRRLPQITNIAANALLQTVRSIDGGDVGRQLAIAAR